MTSVATCSRGTHRKSIVSRAHPDSLDTLQMAVAHTRRELRYVQTLLECSPHCLFAVGRPHRFTHRRVAAVTLGKLQFSLGQADYHPARSRSPVTPLVHLSAGLIDSGPARGPSILVLAVRRGAGLAAVYSVTGSTGLSGPVKGYQPRRMGLALPHGQWMVRATVYLYLRYVDFLRRSNVGRPRRDYSTSNTTPRMSP